MTKYIANTAAGVIAFIGLLTAPSCADKEDITAPATDDSEIVLSVQGMAAPAAGAPAAAEALRVFQFGGGKLVGKSVLKNYDPAEINLVKGATTALYCVTGIELEAAANSAEADFRLTTVRTPEGAQSAPLFMSGSAALEASQHSCQLTMLRGVARVDLNATDAEMEITSITVENAPAASYVFATEAGQFKGATTTYTHSYSEAPTGVEKGVFMLFESASEVNITIHGTADGAEITIPAVINTVERNKVYTVRVYDKNASVKADISMADWEEGDTVTASPDTAHRLSFDLTNSVFPEGVTVDFDNNIIDVPSSGVEGLTVAFMSDLRIDVDNIIFAGDRVEADQIEEKHVNINLHPAVNTATGVVTKIDFDINEQLKARPGYEIRMELRKTNMSIACDELIIRVAPSPYQIETVEIAGLKWMAFNAVSPVLEEQIFPADGLTVEETYQQQWVSTVGNFFQYGRRKGYSPWTKNDPNGNEETARNIPWTDPECMPLPEGYHVASTAEWQKLLPTGTKIPSTYTAGNGEMIKVELVTLPGTLSDSPSAAANRANLLMRYIRFESLETHNVLMLPICGQKTAGWDEYPGSGRIMHNCVIYWIAEDRYIWLFQVSGSGDDLTVSQSRDRWNYNGFVPVRGIKN